MTSSDELVLLVERLRAGDAQALGAFIKATERWAFRIARSMLRQDDRCKDVLQEAYLVVYREIRSLREARAVRNWFTRIVMNQCRRVMRSRKYEPLDAVAETERLGVAGEQSRVDDREDLKRALAALSEIQRSVLLLREVMEQSYEEIAATLEIPLGTVRSRLFEARKQLIESWHGRKPSARARASEAATETSRVSLRQHLQRIIGPRDMANLLRRFAPC